METLQTFSVVVNHFCQDHLALRLMQRLCCWKHWLNFEVEKDERPDDGAVKVSSGKGKKN
jgi:hypothetical protein